MQPEPRTLQEMHERAAAARTRMDAAAREFASRPAPAPKFRPINVEGHRLAREKIFWARLKKHYGVLPILTIGERIQRIKQEVVSDRTVRGRSMTVQDLHDRQYGTSFRPEISIARDFAIYRVREEIGLSFPRIARLFHRTDHTTALWAYRRAKARLEAGGAA